MKKILIFLSLTVFTIALYAQSGNGSSGNPFYGTISGSVQWSVGDPNYGSTVYVGTSTNQDLTIGAGGHLTIDPGITVIFTELTTDLIITSTGRLTAGGSGSPVTFTKAPAKANWGHISFEAMTITNPQNYPSIIDNCIIEYGKSTYGGGVNIAFTYVTISNSIIRNNSSTYIGGGIIINQGSPGFSPTIKNCLIHSNSSTFAAGGLMVWDKSSAIIENCIIRNNSCTNTSTYGGGGVFVYTSTGSAKIINTTIVNNTSSFRGDNVHIHQANNNASFINCAIWGSNNSVYFDNTPKDINFVNSAIQRVYNSSGEIALSTFQNSFKLNSSNTGSSPEGPNFTDPSSNDFSITFVSPCRDAGTTPSPTVPQDYINNSRIGAYDIGAYEVQYSRWKTTAGSDDWSTAANWDGGVPTSTRDIVIPSGATNYPIGTSPVDVTVGSGKLFIMEPGSRATVDDLTNNGLMRMGSNSSGLSSLIMSSYTRGGSASEDIQLYLTGGYIGDPENTEGRWHYISTPVASHPVSTFTTNTLDLARWVDGIQGPLSIREGFVAYDGFAYTVDDPLASPSTWFGYPYRFNTMTLGHGYNFWDNLASYTYSLSGQLNTANVNVTLDFAGQAYENGFNLLGNPFTSGLDWDYILENTSYPANTSQAIYFTKDNVQYTYQSGVQIPDDGIAAPSGVIPPMQGFFVKTYATNETITLAAAGRTHDDIPARYKGTPIIPMVRLAMTDNGSSDETVVRFAEKAVTGLDMGYDALKMFTPANKTAIYTMIPGKKLSINGQPFPEQGAEIQIPVTVNVTSSGSHSISVKHLEALDDYNITLKDNLTGFIANLKTTNELIFTAAAGLISDRFTLTISKMATGVENPVNQAGTFHIYYGFGSINVQTLADEWDGKLGSIRVIDLTGKTVINEVNIEFNKNSIVQVVAPAAKGLYVVEVKSGIQRHVGKVIIN